MKFGLISIFLTGVIEASFVIQKMDMEPTRKSTKSLGIRGKSLINSVSTINRSGQQKSGHRKSRKTARDGWASSVNVISSVGGKSGNFYPSSADSHRKSYRRGKPSSMAPLNSNYLSMSYATGQQMTQTERKSRKFGTPKETKINTSTSVSASASKNRSTKIKSKTNTSTITNTSTNTNTNTDKKIKTKTNASFNPVSVPGISSQGKHLKSGQNLTIDGFVYTFLPANQWTEFYFSEVGQLPFSRWNFDIPADQKCSLQVVDAYCAGDQFQATRLLDSGTETVLLSTPPVPFNPVVAEQIRLGANVNCTPFTTDPATAWASSEWSKGEVALQPGNYKLILKSLLAPYGSGGAYVRLACTSNVTPAPSPTPTPSSVCSYGSSQIKYIRQTVSFTQAANVCYTYGLRPLDVTINNIKEARSVLANCAGVATRAWIASYNGDNYRGTVGLSLHSSQFSDVGAITATPDTSPLEGILCQ